MTNQNSPNDDFPFTEDEDQPFSSDSDSHTTPEDAETRESSDDNTGTDDGNIDQQPHEDDHETNSLDSVSSSVSSLPPVAESDKPSAVEGYGDALVNCAFVVLSNNYEAAVSGDIDALVDSVSKQSSGAANTDAARQLFTELLNVNDESYGFKIHNGVYLFTGTTPLKAHPVFLENGYTDVELLTRFLTDQLSEDDRTSILQELVSDSDKYGLQVQPTESTED